MNSGKVWLAKSLDDVVRFYLEHHYAKLLQMGRRVRSQAFLAVTGPNI
jgi:hypothetical protein